MSKINDGGPAFPVLPPDAGDGTGAAPGYPFPDSGMSLRDWFAGQALSGLIASNDEGAGDRIEEVPRYAYAIADAMLAARDKPVADRASFIELRDMLAHLLDTCVIPESDFKRGHEILAKARGET